MGSQPEAEPEAPGQVGYDVEVSDHSTGKNFTPSSLGASPFVLRFGQTFCTLCR